MEKARQLVRLAGLKVSSAWITGQRAAGVGAGGVGAWWPVSRWRWNKRPRAARRRAAASGQPT